MMKYIIIAFACVLVFVNAAQIINEKTGDCAEEGACDQYCQNSPKGPICSCAEGYFRATPTQCYGIDLPEDVNSWILAYERYELRRFKLRTADKPKLNERETVYNGGQFVAAIMDHNNETICFYTNLNQLLCENPSKRAKSFKLTELDKYNEIFSNKASLIYTDSNTPAEDSKVTHLALDWITLNLYVVVNSKRLSVCSIASNPPKCKLLREGSNIKKITLDPTKGLMFLITKGTNNKFQIEKIGLDGQNPKVLVENIKNGTGITLDLPVEQIYWIDAMDEKVGRIDYDGSNRKLVGNSFELNDINQLVVFENYLFIISSTESNILMVNKFQPMREFETLIKDRRSRAIEIYHRAKQPKGVNPCANTSGTGICVLNWNNDKLEPKWI